MTTITLRPGCIVYVDIYRHQNISKEEFFSNSDIKPMKIYGLIGDFGSIVKVLYEDDIEHNSKCRGLVIPKGCIDEIVYFEEHPMQNPIQHLDASKDHN